MAFIQSHNQDSLFSIKEYQSYYRLDETQCVEALLQAVEIGPLASQNIRAVAEDLIKAVRKKTKTGVDSFLTTYDLSSAEGIALMCLSEALLRIPDPETVDKLIQDKIGSASWESHLGSSDSLFVNAATWALMLTGKIVSFQQGEIPGLSLIFCPLAVFASASMA